MSNSSKKEELKKLLKHKRSRSWYADRLGLTLGRVDELLNEIKGVSDIEEKEGLVKEQIKENGDKYVESISKRPLNKGEIEKLYGIDNISSKLSSYWNKQTPKGNYLVSALIKCMVVDFYTDEELEKKLRDIFPQVKSVKLPKVKNCDKKALVISLADDHIGAVNTSLVFGGKTYKEKTYSQRLEEVLQRVLSLPYKFEEVHIVSLGDQLNGWNSQTTRGGHEVKSLSNKEQFDLYIEDRSSFYDKILNSELSENYFIHDVDNSNHSGLGMSYMANKCLEIYISSKYPQVFREGVTDIIGGFEYGKHVILFTHGKDEKFMKRPMPLNLDPKTDLYIYDYIQGKGYSPYDRNITLYKGDLHSYSVQMGKFGRYINCPSMIGATDYTDANFGNSRPGAVIEIYDKNSQDIITQPIWF